MEESIKALWFDEEMIALGQTFIDDGDWGLPIGLGEEPQLGPSHRPGTP